MHRIDLLAPVVEGQSVTFRWAAEPAATLYRKTSFTMTFPAVVDLSRVPARLWWDIVMLCLHPHWLLLRPCTIHLPLNLAEAERRFWLQHLQNGADTLDALGPAQRRGRPLGVTFVCGELDVPRTPIQGSSFGTSFSGGKDSLLQAGLLCELTTRPLLVATSSPLPPLADHDTERRRAVFSAIQARRDVQFVDVASDFRSIWDNGFSGHMGYGPTVNELTDTFLYMSSLLAAGAALGATHLFVASEAEVQINTPLDGKIVQHSHFMYSAATQRALARLLSAYGIHFGSLIWPLYSLQVQQLLWARYPDICDLQYTCWRVGPGEATCSKCDQCFRIAMTALASGEDPQRMGIDLLKVLAYAPSWEKLFDHNAPLPALPQTSNMARVHRRVWDLIARTSFLHLLGVLLGARPRALFSRPALATLRQFRQLQRRARGLPGLPPQGIREAFLDWLDPALRDRLIALYTQYFPREPRADHAEIHRRSGALSLRTTSTLD
jgi:hypothetical protein